MASQHRCCLCRERDDGRLLIKNVLTLCLLDADSCHNPTTFVECSHAMHSSSVWLSSLPQESDHKIFTVIKNAKVGTAASCTRANQTTATH
jgi:hypothetical protein